MNEPTYDPRLARQYATQHARDKGATPHWLRCEWMWKGERCRLGEGHSGGHEFSLKVPIKEGKE